MSYNVLTKRLVAIMTVFLLIFSFNLSINSSATYINDTDDGVWFDDFRDYNNKTIADINSIESYYQCILNNTTATIKLDDGSNFINYDYSKSKYEDNIEAWDFIDSAINVNGDKLTLFSNLRLNPNNVDTTINSYHFEGYMYDNIKALDGQSAVTESTYGYIQGRVLSPIQYFRFKVDQDVDSIIDMDIRWHYGNFDENAHLTKISLFVWPYGEPIPTWQFIESVDYNEDNIDINDGEEDLRFTDGVYISDDGYIDFIIIGTPENPPEKQSDVGILKTDYVNVSVQLREGFLTEGYLISSLIEPAAGKFNGWEKIIWEGTKPSSTSDIKIQVLKENGDEIPNSELDGNEEGFTSSPVDLTALGNTYNKIKIKAYLNSYDLTYTPNLYSWGVLWQTQEGFYDSFSFNYRVDSINGLKNEEGNIKVSDYYGNWPVFGKKPTNTRSYSNLESKTIDNNTYWVSLYSENTGGAFRSPIVGDGRVFIASSEDIIQAFNETVPDIGDEYEPVDTSKKEYKVDSSLGFSDGILIVPTIDTAINANNKIYGLNSSNLSEELWHYPRSEDKNICFSSAPNIEDGRVYVTTCSKLFWNKPFFSQFYSKITNFINSIFGTRIGYDNKLLVLDLYSGIPVIKPIGLPSSSFSTPTVDDGIIYVGCDNIKGGSSLFAYDENTGDEVWNVSIGLIGRSSPVVADTPEGKTVFVLSREEETFALKGDNKIFALDAETGVPLWNFSIGENTSGYTYIRVKNWISSNFGFDGLMLSSAPISSPAVYGNKLFVLSQDGILYALDIDKNGELLWYFDVTEERGALSYNSASPVVVDGLVYIVTENGKIFILDAETGEVELDFQIKYEFFGDTSPILKVYAPPIVSDGLIYLSANELSFDGFEYIGRLISIGEYNKNTKGKIISTPIHVQKGKWWDKFNATTENDDENNTITFSILDKDDNPIPGFEKIDGDDYDISGVSTNVIKLCALLEIFDETEDHPELKDWGITWNIETEEPRFIKSSFEPDENGWVNEDLEDCSIEAYDVADDGLLSGLDTDSAKFELEYIPKGEDESVKEWFDAECDGALGVKQTRIRANISKLDIDVSALVNITFKIKDLAGNENDSGEPITFKMDSTDPYSVITNELQENYNSDDEVVTILANAADEGDDGGEASGVDFVTLKYKNSTNGKDWSDWFTYKATESPYSWEFGSEDEPELLSNYYQVMTLATDKADNIEEKDEGSDTFLYDIIKPEIDVPTGEHKSMDIPTFEVKISDDFELDSLYYKLEGESNWVKIKSDIDDTEYITDFSVPEDYWLNIFPGNRYHVYFKAVDSCDNSYETGPGFSPVIIKDENVTQFYVDVSDFEEMQWDDKFIIKATFPSNFEVEDSTLFYRFSADSDNLKDIEWEQYGKTLTDAPYQWEFIATEGDGYYEFRTVTRDAETESTFYSQIESTQVTIFPTNATMIMLIIVFLLVVITIYILIKMKKRKK